MTEKSMYLHNISGGHSKQYFLAVIRLPIPSGLYSLRTAYGKIGVKPREDDKNLVFNTLAQAEQAMLDAAQEKIAKGYNLVKLPSNVVGPTWLGDPARQIAPTNPPKTSTAKRVLSKFEERRRTAQWRF
jgi:predicted DNA-binding WGR domain protein